MKITKTKDGEFILRWETEEEEDFCRWLRSNQERIGVTFSDATRDEHLMPHGIAFNLMRH